ncbi:UNVERIFIED_ORG: hypothetical protein QFZ59_002082 [Bacillus sp. B2I3]|nr:hypothetical protein [Bacillus sp. B2I3]
MLSKHHLQRDQLEMITLDQLVPANHLVRKMEASIDPVIIKPLYAKRKERLSMYSQMQKKSIVCVG